MREQNEPGLARGIASIVAVGIVLGVAYNWMGHASRRPWGLEWIAQDSAAVFADTPAVGANDGTSLVTDVDDPLAVPASGASLPEIPAFGRPVPIELGALKQYFDAGAAVIVDAREAVEYAEGHIPGALNMPYDLVVTDPVRLESLDTRGRPVIAYCGGGGCEQSLSLAEELIFAGHERVAVYEGGFPEWQESGYPVETGADEGSS
jgi:rhodanese-related sulfurtransferase